MFTPIELRMLAVLKDGLPHHRSELLACLEDSEAEWQTVYVHLSNIRRKLRVSGQDIICEVQRSKNFYRHVRLLANPYS